MSRRIFPWHARPGLAGGIDKDGSRAAELLAHGFGSVEVGSVWPEHAASVAATLAGGMASRGGAVGLGLGLPADLPEDSLTVAWLAGLAALWPVADYLSFNLSAAANRRFLLPEHRCRLARACRAAVGQRDGRAAASGRYLPLALKLPLGGVGDPLPAAAEIAAAAGFDLLTVVLPEAAGRFARLAELAGQLAGGPALVAVGGIRSAADVAAARAAGAAGVQVHRLFVEQGAACLDSLLCSPGGERSKAPCQPSTVR
ncbi:MAG: dihydroorotate dehydrogenase [Betaproteobacteria bacterium HGW-Betaproteobacteria-12]|nr:MAG: dihydroorotate dehydrogenase [Betaproteobacteria bacterium HGW-Betaproteobacteria-12]